MKKILVLVYFLGCYANSSRGNDRGCAEQMINILNKRPNPEQLSENVALDLVTDPEAFKICTLKSYSNIYFIEGLELYLFKEECTSIEKYSYQDNWVSDVLNQECLDKFDWFQGFQFFFYLYSIVFFFFYIRLNFKKRNRSCEN